MEERAHAIQRAKSSDIVCSVEILLQPYAIQKTDKSCGYAMFTDAHLTIGYLTLLISESIVIACTDFVSRCIHLCHILAHFGHRTGSPPSW